MARPAIEQRLATGRLSLHSWWSFDVPELFSSSEQMYVWLTFGATPDEVPSYEEVRPVLERVFTDYGDAEGVAIRHRPYLWKAIVSD